MRALRPTTRPSRGARREIYLRRELRPARVPVRSRGAADGPCTSPPRRRPKSPRWHLGRTATAGAWRRLRALPALRRADGASTGRPRPLLRTGDQDKGSLRRPLYVQFEARPHRALAGPSRPPTHHLVRSTPARSRSKSTHPMWQAATRGGPQPSLRGRMEGHGLLLHGVRPHHPNPVGHVGPRLTPQPLAFYRTTPLLNHQRYAPRRLCPGAAPLNRCRTCHTITRPVRLCIPCLASLVHACLILRHVPFCATPQAPHHHSSPCEVDSATCTWH